MNYIRKELYMTETHPVLSAWLNCNFKINRTKVRSLQESTLCLLFCERLHWSRGEKYVIWKTRHTIPTRTIQTPLLPSIEQISMKLKKKKKFLKSSQTRYHFSTGVEGSLLAKAEPPTVLSPVLGLLWNSQGAYSTIQHWIYLVFKFHKL